jgi:hypothetical protein
MAASIKIFPIPFSVILCVSARDRLLSLSQPLRQRRDLEPEPALKAPLANDTCQDTPNVKEQDLTPNLEPTIRIQPHLESVVFHSAASDWSTEARSGPSSSKLRFESCLAYRSLKSHPTGD